MLRKLTVTVFAAALALAVSCSGDDSGAPRMPPPIDVEPGVYTVGKAKNWRGRTVNAVWKDGETLDQGGDFGDYLGQEGIEILDFFVTDGYICVITYNYCTLPAEYILWINGSRVREYWPGSGPIAYGQEDETQYGTWPTKVFVEGDRWYRSGTTARYNSKFRCVERRPLLITEEGAQELQHLDEDGNPSDNYLDHHDGLGNSVFVVGGRVIVGGSTKMRHVATLWLDGSPEYLRSDYPYGHDKIATEVEDVVVHGGDVYAAGTTYSGDFAFVPGTVDGETFGPDYYYMPTRALLWKNGDGPVALNGTKERCITWAKSVHVDDGDVYVFGREIERTTQMVALRDVIWKNGGDPVPIGPETVWYRKDGELTSAQGENAGVPAAVSGSDVYSVDHSSKTVLKNGEALFEIKGATAVTRMSVVK
jgi:hypothetical protein